VARLREQPLIRRLYLLHCALDAYPWVVRRILLLSALFWAGCHWILPLGSRPDETGTPDTRAHDGAGDSVFADASGDGSKTGDGPRDGTALHDGTREAASLDQSALDLQQADGPWPKPDLPVGPVSPCSGTWTALPGSLTAHLSGVFCTPPSAIFAVGEQGGVYQRSGASWAILNNTTVGLEAIWGDSGMLFAVGAQQTILESTTGWPTTNSGKGTLHGVWGTSAIDVYAVGSSGAILHKGSTGNWNGKDSVDTTDTVRGVWGDGSTVYAVGEVAATGRIWVSTGSAFSVTMTTPKPLNDIFGTVSTVVAVGDGGQIYRHGPTGWVQEPSGVTASLLGVWGSGASPYFAVGDSGTILCHDGTKWTPQNSGTSYGLQDIWGCGDLVVAVGRYGTALSYNIPPP